MNVDLLKQQQNRGYVIAGGAAIIAFIAFFLPYVTASYLGISASASGASGGWLWFEEIAAIVSIGVAAVLIFRNNAFGLTNMPVEKQVRYGRITLLVAAVLALVLHFLFLLGYQSEVGGGLGTIGAGFSFGLGVAVRVSEGLSSVPGNPGEFTWNGAYGTQFFCDPKERLVVVVGTAAPGEIRKYYREQVQDIVYGAMVR